MLETELTNLIYEIVEKKCESNFIELKSAREGCPRLFDTLSSFSNQSGGGKIIFGINENNNYEICGVYDPADLQKRIMEQSLQMEPNVRPLCTTTKIGEKIVVCAEIQEIDPNLKPCFYKGAGRLKGSYIRVADGDRLMSEYEVYSYEAFKKKIQDELRIAPRAVLEDIKTPVFFKYTQELKIKKPNLSRLSDDKLCRLQGFTDNTAPTLAGILLFSDYPQAFFPQLCITAVSLPGTEINMTGNVGERFIDNKKIDGTLSQMLADALAFVRRNMRVKNIIDPTTGQRMDKPEYPVVAVREIILNALVHRDYSIHTDSAPITIKMFRDRMEVENPGGLYGRMTLNLLGKISADTRNPFLANALELLGETENRYSGIPTILAEMERANLPAPKFENEYGIFRVILFNNEPVAKDFENIEQEITNFCKIPRSRLELIEHFNGEMTIAHIMRKYIKPMIASGKIQLTLPEHPKSKNQKYVIV